MKELQKKLKQLQKDGYETISIVQIFNWMSDIRRERKMKILDRKIKVNKTEKI